MKTAFKFIFCICFMIVSTSTYADIICECKCADKFNEQVHTFPAKGNSVSEEVSYCESNDGEVCKLSLTDEKVREGDYKECRRIGVVKTKDTLNQLGIELN